MKLWIDDIRPAPDGYLWCKSVNDAKWAIGLVETTEVFFPTDAETRKTYIELIDTDHDAGDYAQFGGDYIKLLDWLEEKEYNYPIHIHSMNPVGVQNMRAIIKENGWKEV